jgi:beta-galactosidase
MKDDHGELFNFGWKFLLGDPPEAARNDYNDRTWKRVDLPHDWVISQPFYQGQEPSGKQGMQGYFVWNKVCWYRKEFFVGQLDGKETFLYFGGAYRDCKIYINGMEAGGRAYGFASFELDITPFIKPNSMNLVAVRLDNTAEFPERWYSGGGIYRDVYLRTLPLLRIKTWGVRIKSKVLPNGKGELSLDAEVVNRGEAVKGALRIKILDDKGKEYHNRLIPFDAPAGKEVRVNCQCIIDNPALWSAERPNLYRALLSVEGPGMEDATKVREISFGIRNIEIVPRRGMLVNGKSVKLKGVCLHHDSGILGAAYYDAAWRRKLGTLKGLGCNAIRTSHNIPAEELLDLCDEMGFYVIDEAFDKWKSMAYGPVFDGNWQRDLESMILRDRNHPSVFLWSVGNEVENQGEPSMIAIQKTLTSFVRTLDDRPVTCALRPFSDFGKYIDTPVSRLAELTKNLAEDVDVLGLNYFEPWYDVLTEKIDKPIVGTECYDYYSGGVYNYDDYHTKNPWFFVTENDNVIGQFIWTGMEYLGESRWPAKGWGGAFIDLCGFLKPGAYYRKSIWSGEPMVYLCFYDQNQRPDYTRGRWSFPRTASHLNFDFPERCAVRAAVFTNCEEAELWINGKKVGRKRPADFENRIIEWNFEYLRGEIKVIGYNGGKELCRYELKTAGAPEEIRLNPGKAILKADCGDLAHIEVNITDREGILYPADDLLLGFSLEGDGEIMGACSPDISSPWGYTQPKTLTCGGKALVIIKAGASPGELVLSAFGENLRPGLARFEVL